MYKNGSEIEWYWKIKIYSGTFIIQKISGIKETVLTGWNKIETGLLGEGIVSQYTESCEGHPWSWLEGNR